MSLSLTKLLWEGTRVPSRSIRAFFQESLENGTEKGSKTDKMLRDRESIVKFKIFNGGEMAAISGPAYLNNAGGGSAVPASEVQQAECVGPVVYNACLAPRLLPLEPQTSTKIEQLRLLPLLAQENPLILDHELLSTDLQQCSLYFGTGLCTTKEMSAGLPFDILGLIATAEKIRRILGFGKVIQLIADTHAKSNKFESDDQVDARAAEFKRQIMTATQRLGLDRTYQVILISDFDRSAAYMEIYGSIAPTIAHEYVRREWSDMEYLAKKENTRLKLSWKMPVKRGKVHKSDEAFFDSGYVDHFRRPYSFISNSASITFDPARLNVCPYTSVAGEKRILIKSDEDAEIKLREYSKSARKIFDRAIVPLAATVKLLERTFELQLPQENLGRKINHIIRKLFY